MKMSWLSDFFHLFFPRNCCVCGNPLVASEKEICLSCLLNLPLALTAKGDGNFVERRFWGRVSLNAATALLLFQHGNITQRILHLIKYSDNQRLAVIMGRQMGLLLKEDPRFDSVDVIVPVPLHIKKLRKRGYNQSLLLCRGLSNIIARPIICDALSRIKHTPSQTLKTREQRFDNMIDSFRVVNSLALQNKHILLVDDVITTGATTEACCLALNAIDGIRISIAALAVAGDT